MKFLLIPLSWIYRLVIVIRHRLFDWGVLRSEKFDIPIICVGNITVGGTGKTPVVETIVGGLGKKFNIAVLSRGYGRKSKGYLEVETDTPFRKSGDEPKQIKIKYPRTVVAVCEKRAEGIRTLRERHPEIDLIVMDDGFQHRYVEPAINIVLMDYNRPIVRDRMLPAGSLRDLPSQMHRAHYVIVTKCPGDMQPISRRLRTKELALYPYQELFFTTIESGSPRALYRREFDVQAAERRHAVVMAGIGNPKPFVKYVESRYEVIETFLFGDHHVYGSDDLRRVAKALSSAPEDTVLLTTEKDAVKLTSGRKVPHLVRQRLCYIPISISFMEDSKEDFLQKLEHDVRKDQTDI